MKRVLLSMALVLVVAINHVSASIPMQSAQVEENVTTAEQLKKITSNSFSELLEMNGFETIEAELTASENSSSKLMDEELIITLLLWFFLGFLAGHRWYRGKPTGWNILFILTGGGCGIWALVDLVHILTGRF